MPMKEDLRLLVESVPGALGAILSDWDGEAVDHAACMDAYDLKVLGEQVWPRSGVLSNTVRIHGWDSMRRQTFATY